MNNSKIWAFKPPKENEIKAFNEWLGIENKKGECKCYLNYLLQYLKTIR